MEQKGLISDRKALDCVKTLLEFHEQQKSCQNCLFRKFGCDHWDCYINAYDLKYNLNNIISNNLAKRKNHGYLK